MFESADMKVGDLVVCTKNVEGLNARNHIGHLRQYGVEFINKFSDRLHDLNETINTKNGWFIDKNILEPFSDNNNGKNIPLVYDESFREFVKYSLRFLIDYERIYYSDVSYVSLSDKNDMVSCLTLNNYKKLTNKDDVWTTPLRSNMGVGRFIKKILPNETGPFIEDYINDFKFSFNLTKTNMGSFKKIAGEEMRPWYLERNYAFGGGTLNQSCMRHTKSQRRLSLYTQNVDKIRLLAIINPEGKLLGRALLWKLDSPANAFYMDRIYTTESYIEKFFKDYAKKMNFLTFDIVDEKNIKMTVELSRDFGPPSINPYMDTFKFFVRDGCYLTNRFDNLKAGQFWTYNDHD